jgi:hypothetical protein
VLSIGMNHVMSIVLAAVVSVSVSVSASAVTDRYFGDLTVYSPGKKYRLEAKSPDNAGVRKKPFAASFVYTMYEEATKAKVWERRQPMKDGQYGAWSDGEYSPTAAYVTDQGNVVVATGHDELFVLSATDGTKVGQIDILDQFTEKDRKDYVSNTTAGPMWKGGSRWSFLEVKDEKGAGALYFVVRPFWERRVVLDVAKGTLVEMGDAAMCGETTLKDPKVPRDAKIAGIVRAIRDDEASWALETLGKAARSGLSLTDSQMRRDVYAAASIVGRRDEKKAVPVLRTLEKFDHVSSSSSTGVDKRALRGIAHTALRRLGETPASEPAITLRVSRRDQGLSTGDPVVSTVTIKERAAKADGVKVGMTVHELVAAVGLPDFEVEDRSNGLALDYDMDASTPFTLRLVLEDNKVVSVRRIEPAVWKDGYERDR